MHLSAQITDSITECALEQTFENQMPNPIEALFQFPASKEFTITGVTIKTKEKTIETKIMEKEEAKQKYDDSVAQGNLSVGVDYSEELPEMLNLKIGAVQPGQEVKIIVKMATMCVSIKHGQFCFIFPHEFLPVMCPKLNEKSTATKCSVEMTLKCESEIQQLNVSHDCFVHRNEGDEHVISIEEMENFDTKDIVVSFAQKSVRNAHVSLYSSEEHEDELVAHLSYIPRFSGKLEEEKTDHFNPNLTEPDSTKDEGEMASGEFIFVIDRSYSMRSNDRIEVAKAALALFIQSLHENSKFNIVSFGNNFTKMHKESVDFSDDSKKEALEEISTFKADMGGTNIFKPLKSIFGQEVDVSLPKSIFLLTDGQIFDKEKTIALITKNNANARVHTFGIGDEADVFLVKECAKEGKGTYHMVDDAQGGLTSKVITALREASRPAMTDIKLDWGEMTDCIKYTSEVCQKHDDVYEEEPMNIMAFLYKDKLLKLPPESLSITLTYTNTLKNTSESFKIPLNPSKPTPSPTSFALTAQHYLSHYTHPNSPLTHISKSTHIALTYSILSKTTAFFGKVKTKQKSGEEIVNISTVPIAKKTGGYNKHTSIGIAASRRRVMYGASCRGGAVRHSGRGAVLGSSVNNGFRGRGGCGGRGGRGGGLQFLNKKTWHPAPVTLQADSLMREARDIPSSGGAERLARVYGTEFSKPSRNRSRSNSREKPYNPSPNLELLTTPTLNTPKDSNYSDLTSLQHSNGSFSSLPSRFNHFISVFPDSLPSTLEPRLRDLLNTTMVAMGVLKGRFGDFKAEWALIYKKAMKFCLKEMDKDDVEKVVFEYYRKAYHELHNP